MSGRRGRLGIVTTSYPRSADDPAGHFVAGLNRFLRERGYELDVLAAGEPPEASESASESVPGSEDGSGGLRVRRIASPLFYRGGAPDALSAPGTRLRSAFFAARFSAELLAACARHARRWDAVISHWTVPCGLSVLCAAPRLPHVAIAHSSDIHLLRRLRLTGAVRLLARRARLCYAADTLVVPGAPGVVVPMGVHRADYAPPPGGRAGARARLGLTSQDTPVLLSLARLVPVKGLGRLLTAVAQLRADGQPLLLLLAGDGPLRPALEARAHALGLLTGASPAVRFLGEVRGTAKLDLLYAADALALTSEVLPDGRTEGTPTVLVEALCAGLPIVTTAAGGAGPLVGDAGCVVPPGDTPALTAALARTLRGALDPTLRPVLQARALARAARYDWSALAPRILGPLLTGPGPDARMDARADAGADASSPPRL